MKFNTPNDENSSDKVEPQLDATSVEQEDSNEKPNFVHQETFSEQDKTTTSNEKTMENKPHNPILDFVKNLGETTQYVWDHYFDWVIHVSWGKMFLTCLLVLIGGSILCLHSLANWFVFGSLLLKCFVGKEDQVNKTKDTNNIHTEGS